MLAAPVAAPKPAPVPEVAVGDRWAARTVTPPPAPDAGTELCCGPV
ncbi:hypothetical protein I546_3821 [Mycobacterium kansasii 732]|nr:hypothetical protein I546_3821 [Mycobacterium kansasii 732]